MKWIIEGANPQTGKELVRDVDAPTREAAENLANTKGMLVASVRPAVAACENCDHVFGKLENPKEHNGHVVCAKCLSILAPGTLDYEAPPIAAVAPKAPPGAAATVDLTAKYRNYGMRTCPGCGSHSPPVKKSKGSGAVLVLLLLLWIVPGILYAIFNSGCIFVCPECGMKLGDAT